MIADPRRRRALLRARARGKLLVLGRIPVPRSEGTPWSNGPDWNQPMRLAQGRISSLSILTGSRINGG